MTNFEKIKSMSIEAMSEWMYIHINCFECLCENSGLHCNDNTDCREVMKLYLEQEVK